MVSRFAGTMGQPNGAVMREMGAGVGQGGRYDQMGGRAICQQQQGRVMGRSIMGNGCKCQQCVGGSGRATAATNGCKWRVSMLARMVSGGGVAGGEMLRVVGGAGGCNGYGR